MTPTVIKVGGSLYDLPDLGARLRRWLSDAALPQPLLVPGGGPTADVIRQFDERFALGDEVAHWLALRALTVNAHMLVGLIGGTVVAKWEECRAIWERNSVPVLDGHAFATADEVNADHLPHTWEVTSDSLAARVAVVGGARRLVLLKSLEIPAGVGWEEAARRGWVDRFIPVVLGRHPKLVVETINFPSRP
jgi:5-(aminomethyl)-3-furanmethanol phosphate kinase